MWTCSISCQSVDLGSDESGSQLTRFAASRRARTLSWVCAKALAPLSGGQQETVCREKSTSQRWMVTCAQYAPKKRTLDEKHRACSWIFCTTRCADFSVGKARSPACTKSWETNQDLDPADTREGGGVLHEGTPKHSKNKVHHAGSMLHPMQPPMRVNCNNRRSTGPPKLVSTAYRFQTASRIRAYGELSIRMTARLSISVYTISASWAARCVSNHTTASEPTQNQRQRRNKSTTKQ